MVLEDVTEFDYSGTNTKLQRILLNGNNICMVSGHVHVVAMAGAGFCMLTYIKLIPGGEGPVAA